MIYYSYKSALKKRYKDGDEDMIYTLSDELRDEGYALGLKEGHELGLAEGHELGLVEGHTELIQNMLQYGMTPEIIAEATKVSIDQVFEIQAAAE